MIGKRVAAFSAGMFVVLLLTTSRNAFADYIEYKPVGGTSNYGGTCEPDCRYLWGRYFKYNSSTDHWDNYENPIYLGNADPSGSGSKTWNESGRYKIRIACSDSNSEAPDSGWMSVGEVYVFKVDLEASGVAEADEESIGAFVAVNGSRNLTLHVDPVGLPAAHTVKITWDEADDGKIRILKSSDMTEVHYNSNNEWCPHQVQNGLTLYLRGESASSSVRDIELRLQYFDDAEPTPQKLDEDKVKVTVIEVKINNPVNPNKGPGLSNDSDDYFFRGPSEGNVKVYYDFLPSGLTATSVKLKIKDGGTALKTFDKSTSSGAHLLANDWNGKDGDNYYNKWDFRAVIEVVLNGITYTSNEHPIADPIFKHRPYIYTHGNEFSGPVAVNIMMDYSDLYHTSDDENSVAQEDLSFSDLSGDHDDEEYYQRFNDPNEDRQRSTGTHVVYCRGVKAGSYLYLQYWMFEPSSTTPYLGTWPVGARAYVHEGDWEMVQVNLELDTTAEEIDPHSCTASQHYYGQSLDWDEEEGDTAPPAAGHDYVGKNGHRPIVYIAVGAHAVYFRTGGHVDVNAWPPGVTEDEGCQYNNGYSCWEACAANTVWGYSLKHVLDDDMVGEWEGRWGDSQSELEDYEKGPRSPKWRKGSANMWLNPRIFHNNHNWNNKSHNIP